MPRKTISMITIPALALGAMLMAAPTLAAEGPAPLPVEGLREVEHSSLDTVRVRPGVDLGQYRQILLAPIELAIARERDALALEPRDKEHAQEYFTRKLTDAFGRTNLATAPGPGVLELKITMTEFVPNSPAFARRQDGLGGLVTRSYGVGSAAFQAVLTDTQTGQVVAALADADVGLPFTQNLNVNTQYGDADKFIRRWAKEIARMVEGRAAS